jgi:uncharacterized membrane protein
MAWNTFLALIPALLAYRLFRPEARRGVHWWLGAATFVAFLPNAAYVLTDVVHLPADVRIAYPDLTMTAAVLVVYAGFATVGFAAYAYSVLRLVRYLRDQGIGRFGLIASELSIHCLVAVGVVLGRVFRFNSWDLLARPGEVLEAIRLPPSERGIAIVAFLVAAFALGTLLARTLARLGGRWPRT